MKVILINNYVKKEKISKILSILNLLGQEVRIFRYDWNYADEEKNFDCTILSGSESMLSSRETRDKYKKEIEYVKHAERPILGICFGHQLISSAHGSDVINSGRRYRGYYKTRVLVHDELFQGLDDSEYFWEDHEEIVANLPRGFVQIAQGTTNKFQVIKKRNEPIYGLQFHPEHYNLRYESGLMVITNFLKMCKK